MDYDDNDFRSQGFPLAGEENVKFSPSLQSYSLPKFDLDENLHVHLRYDNLVDSEVLLGIQGHEENQWIEDFSRGSSGIEFSSSAPESCSIARHHNVWSEATSTESVEMLLKSVGQDDLIIRKTTIEESDACDEHEILRNQMEPNLERDGSTATQMRVDMDAVPTVPHDECLDRPSMVGADFADDKAQIEGSHQADGAVPNSHGEGSGNMELKGDSFGNETCDEMEQKEESNLIDAFKENKSSDGSALSNRNPSFTEAQCFAVNAGELSNSFENDSVKKLSEQLVSREENQTSVLTGEGGNTKNIEDHLEKPSDLAPKLDSMVKTAEITSGGLFSESVFQTSRWKDAVHTDTDMHGQFTSNVKELCVAAGHNPFVVPLSAGISSSSVLTMYPSDQQRIQGNDSAETSEKHTVLPDGFSDRLVGEDFVSNKKSSISVISESIATENVKVDDSLRIHKAESSAGDYISSSVLAESGERCDRKLEYGSCDSQSESADISVFGNENAKSSFNTVSSVDVALVPVYLSKNKLEDVQHMLLASDGSNVEVTDHKGNMKEPLSAECSINLVGGEESATRIPVKPSLLDEKESSSVASDPSAVSDIEKNLCCNNAGEMVLETVGHSSTLEDNAIRNDSQVLTDEKAARQCSHESEHQLSIQVSSDGKNDSAALGEMHKVNSLNAPEISSSRPATLLESEYEFHASEAVSPSINSSVPNCGSPTIISSSQTSQNDIDYQREGLKSLDQNASLPDEIGVGKKDGSSTQDRKENVASEDDRSFTFKVGSLGDLAEKEISKGWIPFSNHESYASDQNIDASATTSVSYQLYPDAMQGTFESPQNSGVKEICQNVKTSADDATTPISHGLMETATTKEGTPFKDVISQSDRVQRSTCEGTQVIDKLDLGVNKVDASGHRPKENIDFEAASCGTTEVRSLISLSNKETGSIRKPSSKTQANDFTQAVVVPPTTSGICQIDVKVVQEIPHVSPRKSSAAKNVRRRSKETTEDKKKTLSSQTTEKEISKGGKPLKELKSPKQTKMRGSNSVVATSSPLGDVIQGGQSESTRSVYSIGSSGKPSVIPTIQTSNLPDLNSSASLFQQPFSDFQQVQLRAQIFVYGSLIQGTAPDEACMVSAFGESDGGRSTWEPVWRVALERIQSQKSPLSNHEAPVLLQAGAQVSDQAVKQNVHHSDPLSTPNRTGNKAPPAGNIYSAMPFSSPLWTISTPYDDAQSSSMLRGTPTDLQKSLPFRPYHSPHLKHYTANTPWHPQAPSGTWVLTPHSTSVDLTAHHPVKSMPETAHVASVRESSISHPSVVHNVPPGPLTQSVTQSVVSTTVPAIHSLEQKIMTASDSKNTADVKARKRKKALAIDNSNISSLVQTQTDSVSTGPHLPTSVSAAAPIASPSRVVSGNVVPIGPQVPSTYYQIVGGHDKEQRVIFSDETSSRIEQAKQQAEDAAAFAASAVKHCENIWSQLAMQKNSGLVSDNEAKLASSAVAIAAAASVAKAAAAAARVAADAALQAKLMADESFVANKSKTAPDAPLYDAAKNLGIVSPSSILKGRGATGTSDSVLVTAREAARKRVEAASAAAKRAENLDAVVKAAEVAAEAVSQAGIIIAMGEPIPLTLTELVEAGPENYWRTQQTSPGLLVQSKNRICTEQTNMDGVDVGLGRLPLNAKETKRFSGQGKNVYSNEIPQSSAENQILMLNGTHLDSVMSNKWGMNLQNVCNATDLTKTIGVVPESQVGAMSSSMNIQKDNNEGHTFARTLEENGIKEGSLVEVLSSENSGVKVWYCAKVLSVKDGKAHVCYTERIGDEGSGQPSDWVPLEGGDKASRIRIAHPMSLAKHEGAKKRRRSARGDYTWSVGDKVDAWMQNSWWEGVITEKSKEDETNLTFQFSAQGDTSIVKAWHIRPSLIWESGQWIEWSRSRESSYLNEGDMSQLKPLKRGRHGSEFEHAAEAGAKNNMPKDLSIQESGNPVPSQPLALSAKEKLFTVGRSSKDDKNSDLLRTKRIGLQKGGSKVIFGVPKPGKKRKFMDVSKHYVSDGAGKINSGNDPMKFSKYHVPQKSTSRGWRNTSKIVSKGKQLVELKPKTVKSTKTQNTLSRSVSGKDNSSTSVSSGLHDDGVVQDPIPNVKGSVDGDEGMPETQNIHEDHFPKSSTTAEIAAFATDTSSDPPPLKKKLSSSVTAELGNKGRTALPGEKVAKNDEKNAGQSDNAGKSMSNALEPRRSNRRIQPTSRLLEGLQSSLIISKIPIIPHDKGTKSQQRTSSRGN